MRKLTSLFALSFFYASVTFAAAVEYVGVNDQVKVVITLDDDGTGQKVTTKITGDESIYNFGTEKITSWTEVDNKIIIYVRSNTSVPNDDKKELEIYEGGEVLGTQHYLPVKYLRKTGTKPKKYTSEDLEGLTFKSSHKWGNGLLTYTMTFLSNYRYVLRRYQDGETSEPESGFWSYDTNGYLVADPVQQDYFGKIPPYRFEVLDNKTVLFKQNESLWNPLRRN